MASEKLYFSAENRQFVDAYIPKHNAEEQTRPFVTLTYACSLDSQISVAPGVPTALSGSASKSMTHYLRTKHDAILVGSGTAIADDPGLNSRIEDAVDAQGLSLQPRPIIFDRRARWRLNRDTRVIKTAYAGKGRGPFIAVSSHDMNEITDQEKRVVEECEGQYIVCEDFPSLLQALHERDIRSVMVEGGGQIINALLKDHVDLVDGIIVTIAPIYLGSGGVSVRPEKTEESSTQPAVKLCDVKWLPLENDVVMCARIASHSRT